MPRLKKWLVLGLLGLSLQTRAQGPDPLKSSVVKVFVVVKPADFYQPWQMGYQSSASGSGLILKGGQILTNAHVVGDQVHIQVMKAGDTHKATAKVKFVADDSDLALLTVDEPGFFDGTTPVTFGSLPRQRDHVAAYGFPAGGDELSITEGVVSRIEVRTYVHADTNLLTVQTDAAINPGNSGGPVFKDGKFIGVSFEGYGGAALQNTGYFIPIPVVNRFLKDIADGHYDGVPGMGVVWQKLENPSLRAWLGLKQPRGGVMICKIIPGSGADGLLKENDVILSLDGVDVAENGTIPFADEERVDLMHLVTMHQMGEKAHLKLMRDGKPLELDVPLGKLPDLVPGPTYGQRASYFVYGGLVFQPLSANYMRVWEGQGPSQFRLLAEQGLATDADQQVVFINTVLPNDVNVGYHKLGQAIVSKINGQDIHKMKDVIEAFKKPLNGYQVIDVDHWAGAPDNRGTHIILDAKKADAANADILAAFGIPSDRSEDLQEPQAATATAK
jgi:S1-C subfamily serine protease